MREKEREFFISLFGGYILLILCVCAISKKHLKPKRKNLLGLRFFHLSRGRREEGERKSIVFANRGKSPLFYKNNTRNRNAKRPVCMRTRTGREA